MLPEWRVLIDVECAHIVGVCMMMGGAQAQTQEGFTATDATDYGVGFLTSTDR